jgi:hypothetical protein
VSSVRPGTARDWIFAAVGTAIFVAIVAFATAHHEMWRDEIDAWLVARDSPTPLAIFPAIRYGGHPSLWYLLLWPLAHATHALAAMQALNVVIAGGTAFLVLRWAPGPRWLRALAVSGYFPVYEYGTIARNYGLSVLSLVIACCVFPQRRERPLLLGLLLGLAAHTSAHAMILALALTAAVTGELVARWRWAAREWGGVALAVVLFALASWQMRPPGDSGYAPGWSFVFEPTKVANTLSTVAEAWLPLPPPGRFFWGNLLLAQVPGFADVSWVLSIALLGAAIVALERQWVALVAFTSGVAGLLTFFHVKFSGYLRHHGFLWVALLAAIWIAASEAALAGRPARQEHRASRWRERMILGSLIILFAVHTGAALVAVHGEWRYRFSAAEATADLMRSRAVDRLEMVGARDVTAMAVLGYLDKSRAYYPDGRRFGSHIVYDAARLAPRSLWGDAWNLAGALGAPVSIVVDIGTLRRDPPPEALRPRLVEVGCEASEIQEDESYCVLVLTP